MSHTMATPAEQRRVPQRAAFTALAALLTMNLACSAQEPAAVAEATDAARASAAAEQTAAAEMAPAAEPIVVAEAATDGDKPYDIECDDSGNCLVDKATYIGWRTYHNACHVCHAQDAVGSTFAPSLVTRLQQIDKERFYSSVNKGYQGQIGVMPAWENDPNVSPRIDDLYAYLKARSDGALPAGRPERKR